MSRAKQKNSVELRGKSGKSLSRYFPEMVEAFAALEQQRVILDGELIIEINGKLSFDALQMHTHAIQAGLPVLVFIGQDRTLMCSRIVIIK